MFCVLCACVRACVCEYLFQNEAVRESAFQTRNRVCILVLYRRVICSFRVKCWIADCAGGCELCIFLLCEGRGGGWEGDGARSCFPQANMAPAQKAPHRIEIETENRFFFFYRVRVNLSCVACRG